MYTNYFYFDIETTTKFPTFFDFNLDDNKGAELFRKKKSSLSRFEADWDGELDSVYINKGPLLPEYGKIICMSFGMYKDDVLKSGVIVEANEEALLRRMVRVFNRASELHRTLAGYNIKSFDIPFIVKKLYKYQIEIPKSLNFNGLKPWEIFIADLAENWKGIGKNMSSLDEVAYELGIDEPKSKLTGEDVYDYYWNKKDINSIAEKCESDVLTTVEVAKRLKI